MRTPDVANGPEGSSCHPTQQNVSEHLGIVQRSGIVDRLKQGDFAYYPIIDEDVFSICEAGCGSLQASRARVSGEPAE